MGKIQYYWESRHLIKPRRLVLAVVAGRRRARSAAAPAPNRPPLAPGGRLHPALPFFPVELIQPRLAKCKCTVATAVGVGADEDVVDVCPFVEDGRLRFH